MKSLKDDRGYNQIWVDTQSTRIRTERRCDALIAEMQVSPEKSVMEIGCGMGINCFMMAEKTGMQVLGTDICVPFIEEARKNFVHKNLRYELFDFNQAEQFKGEKFDYIVGNGILHHLYYNLDKALINLKHLLKVNGKIIFWEPNISNPYVYFIFSYPILRKATHLEPDEMAFGKRFIEKKLETAGFKDINVSHRDFLLPGIPGFLIKPSILAGNLFEKIPLVRNVSQSLFIVAG